MSIFMDTFTIGTMTNDDVEEFDIFNSLNSYNDSNIEVDEYNCMAYVFGAYKWLNPIDFYDEDLESLEKEARININNKKLCKKIERAYYDCNYNNHFIRKIIIQRLLKAFPELRIVNSFNEITDNEYGIAFATRIDDYHFIRFENGIYSHKQGRLKIEEVFNDETAFKANGYNSKIIRFAIPKKKVKFQELEAML